MINFKKNSSLMLCVIVIFFRPRRLVQWSLQEHLEMSGDDSLTKEDKQNLLLFDKIGDGIFIHTEENRGYIKFYSMVNDRQEPFGIRMI